MKYLTLLIVVAAARLCTAATAPNIIYILADDLGYGDLSVYGQTHFTTPNIDRLAEEGVRFTDFYAAAPFCSPSRAALLTGRYPTRCGVPYVLFPAEHHGLPSDELTLAEHVKAHGYSTACIGKWHLGWDRPFRPARHGFDLFYGLPYSNDSREWAVGNAPLRWRSIARLRAVRVSQASGLSGSPVRGQVSSARTSASDSASSASASDPVRATSRATSLP